MNNTAFSLACENVGGQTNMARLLGTSQQKVWSWINKTRLGVPAEFCLKVEAVSGVSRHSLRPDIYPADSVYTTICTEDGTWLARDPVTGLTATGPTLAEAVAELRRVLSARRAA